nr:MAG TPA: tail tape measure protein [Caudoviricetes sp.]
MKVYYTSILFYFVQNMADNHIIGVTIGVDTSKAKKDLNAFKDDIKGFNERTKNDRAVELKMNVGKLEAELGRAKKLIKGAQANGDFQAEIKFRADTALLQNQLTQAKRELRNFLRTGDEEMSVLGKNFQAVSGGGFLSGMLGKLGGLVGIGSIGMIGKEVIGLGDKLEQANISFEVMLGSAEKAQKMLADLSEFAQKTPFELQGIRDSAKQLMAMGIPAEKMIKTLKVLGDISAGTGAPLQQIAYAYGQVATAGVATTQDMNQLVNAGIPIWKELGKVVGVTASEVKKMVEGRQITFEQVETALTNMTEKGGQFADLMEAQSHTLTGQWNAFKDSLGAIGEQIGLAIIPAFKTGIEWLNFWVESFLNFKQAVQPILDEI